MKKWLVGLVAVASAAAMTVTAGAEPQEDWEFKSLMGLSSTDLPMNRVAAEEVTLSPGALVTAPADDSISLDGTWQLAMDGTTSSRLGGNFDDAIPAEVPGSIHTALMNAGVIEDPYVGTNAVEARAMSAEHDWWYRTTFNFDGVEAGERVMLEFDGICDRVLVYLNGEEIDYHQGMFGGPYLDITDKVKPGENEVVLNLLRAIPWGQTVVFNCSYGWHYSQIAPLGVWENVAVRTYRDVKFDSPFISTEDGPTGRMNLYVALESDSDTVAGTLRGTISPKNFDGESYSFTFAVDAKEERIDFNIPNPQLWWPNGLGDQNLYWLELAFYDGNGTLQDYDKTSFGIRELDFGENPLSPNSYSRVTTINEKEFFLKGAGWCTSDALMRFTREDYDRILRRAKEQGVNWFRAWGGGLVETEEFYDLCDEYGITIMQEWPSCWNSHLGQPSDVFEETVILNTKRLRNRPSLIVWCGGNEGSVADNDPVMFPVIGKNTYLNDGTRPFLRQDGYGVTHDHLRWDGGYPEVYLERYGDGVSNVINLHEYGLDAMMNYNSIKRYATEEEMAVWPLAQEGTIAYHTATFNGGAGIHDLSSSQPSFNGIAGGPPLRTDKYSGVIEDDWDLDHYTFHSRAFIDNVDSLEDVILGSQLAQAMADMPIILNYRATWPNIQSMAYYKLNDVAPAGSWAVVDWYGAPKIAYYFIQDAYAPTMGVVRLPSLNTYDKATAVYNLPVHMVDDAECLEGKNWKVTVKLYNNSLQLVKSQEYTGSGQVVGKNQQLGTFDVTAEEFNTYPAIIVMDTAIDGETVARAYVPMNYDKVRGSLFKLPRAELEYTVNDGSVTIENKSDVPAVAVTVNCYDHEDMFYPSDNYFFMEPGETKTVSYYFKDGETYELDGVSAFNIKDASDTEAPAAPAGLKTEITHNSITVSWDETEDESVYAHQILVNDAAVTTVSVGITSYTLENLTECTDYKIEVVALDLGGNVSEPAVKQVQTAADLVKPEIIKATNTQGKISITFSEPMTEETISNLASYSLTEGATVTGVTVIDSENVELTANDILSGKAYVITVSGAKDQSQNGNECDITYTFYGNMLLWWDFNSFDETMTDRSGNGNHGAVTGGTAVNGVFDGGYKTAGSAEYITISNPNLKFGNSFTVAGWFKADTTAANAQSGYQVLFARGEKVTGHFEIYMRYGSLGMYAPDMGDFHSNSVALNDNKWHHMAITNENGLVKFYVDGVMIHSEQSAGAGIADIERPFRLGSLVDGSLASQASYDDLRIYSGALGQTEIEKLMEKEPTKDVALQLFADGVQTNRLRAGKITATATTISDEPYQVFAALYSNGKLQQVKILTAASFAEGAQVEVFDFTGATDLSTYEMKLYPWNGIKPRGNVIAADGRLPFDVDFDEQTAQVVYEDAFDGKTPAQIAQNWEFIEGTGYAEPVDSAGWLRSIWYPGQSVGYIYKDALQNAKYDFDVKIEAGAQTGIMLRTTVKGGNGYGYLGADTIEQGNGIGIYLSKDDVVNNFILRIANADGELLSNAKEIALPMPAGVDFTQGAHMTIYDMDNRIAIYVNDQPVAAIELDGRVGTYYTTGTVYNGNNEEIGTFDKNVIAESRFSILNRTAVIYIDNLKITK